MKTEIIKLKIVVSDDYVHEIAVFDSPVVPNDGSRIVIDEGVFDVENSLYYFGSGCLKYVMVHVRKI